MARCLVIGDLHLPVVRKGYLQFCKDIYRSRKCDTVVFIGDIIDWSAISFHAHNPAGPGPVDEFVLAFNAVKVWHKTFKNARVTIGNHDCRPQRVAESMNIPAKFIRDYSELWKTPGWEWGNHYIIDNVYYHHGHKKGGGKTPAWNLACKMGLSCVIGHHHSKGGINWSANPLRRWFGMDVGCGIDDEAYAFAYASEQPARSILSAGVVIDGVPEHIIMECGKGERYHDSKF